MQSANLELLAQIDFLNIKLTSLERDSFVLRKKINVLETDCSCFCFGLEGWRTWFKLSTRELSSFDIVFVEFLIISNIITLAVSTKCYNKKRMRAITEVNHTNSIFD